MQKVVDRLNQLIPQSLEGGKISAGDHAMHTEGSATLVTHAEVLPQSSLRGITESDLERLDSTQSWSMPGRKSIAHSADAFSNLNFWSIFCIHCKQHVQVDVDRQSARTADCQSGTYADTLSDMAIDEWVKSYVAQEEHDNRDDRMSQASSQPTVRDYDPNFDCR